MIYRFGITTSANTTEANATETDLPLGHGIIHKIDIYFPPGCSGLLHVVIRDALHQVFPFNRGESFAGNGETISFLEHLSLEAEPYELRAYTWNEDDTYDHDCIIRIGLLKKEFITPELMTWSEKLKMIFR